MHALNFIKKRIATSALFFALLVSSACGWQLRGSQNPNSGDPLAASRIEALRIISTERNNAFFRSFKALLTQNAISIRDDAELLLQISPETLERTPLTYSKIGVPAQYKLQLEIEYQVSNKNDVMVPQTRIIARRSYDFDPDLIIEKDREEQELLKEMRLELSQRMLTSITKAL